MKVSVSNHTKGNSNDVNNINKMKRLVDLQKIDRLDKLIRRKSTGKPNDLAKRLGMSRSSLYELLSYLKSELHAPIIYDNSRESYVYEYVPKFYLGFDENKND